MADFLNLPVERFDDCEASGRGAAMVGAAAVGWYPSIEAASLAMVGTSERTEPNQQTAERYSRIYQQTYSRLYPTLKSIFSRLNV